MVQARLRSIFVPPLARSVFLQVELEDKTIDASGVVDGDPSAVLNLVWSLVLHFQASLSHHTSPQVVSVCQTETGLICFAPIQVKQAVGGIQERSSSLPPCSAGAQPSNGQQATRESSPHGATLRALLQRVQRCTSR